MVHLVSTLVMGGTIMGKSSALFLVGGDNLKHYIDQR